MNYVVTVAAQCPESFPGGSLKVPLANGYAPLCPLLLLFAKAEAGVKFEGCEWFFFCVRHSCSLLAEIPRSASRTLIVSQG